MQGGGGKAVVFWDTSPKMAKENQEGVEISRKVDANGLTKRE